MSSCLTPWLAVAFMRGDPHVPRDKLISGVTRGPYVHTEIMLGSGAMGLGGARAYAAFEGVSGFTPSASEIVQEQTGVPLGKWTVVRYPLPLGGYEKAYALVLQMLAMDLPYNRRDLWQCCIRLCLPFEADLDCERPDTWKPMGGVFCSQVALLFLRRMTRMGLIPHLEPLSHQLETTNSRGCSPNDLFRILAPHEKKI
jgi:hypothetical protein